jgi:hypothetical protein
MEVRLLTKVQEVVVEMKDPIIRGLSNQMKRNQLTISTIIIINTHENVDLLRGKYHKVTVLIMLDISSKWPIQDKQISQVLFNTLPSNLNFKHGKIR